MIIKKPIPFKFVIIHLYTWNNPPSIGKSHNNSFKSYTNINITSPHVFRIIGLLETTKRWLKD
jgi:hypothetical protein